MTFQETKIDATANAGNGFPYNILVYAALPALGIPF